MKVEKIDHLHIAVNDLDKATSFFEDILGTKFGETLHVPDWDLRSRLDPLGIELIQPTSPDGVIAKFIERRGEGLCAISLKVPDIEEAIEELQAKGLRLVSRVNLGNLKEAQFHPKDAYGVMIELAEYQGTHGAEVSAIGKRVT